MHSQLTQTLLIIILMTACALVVGGFSYLLCLLLRKLGILWAWSILVAIACYVLFLLLSRTLFILLILCGVAGLCALLKTPNGKRWGITFRFLFVSGSSALIFGALLLNLIWSFVSNGATKVDFFRDSQLFLLAMAPCAISAIHTVFVSSWLQPGIDRHLREGESE